MYKSASILIVPADKLPDTPKAFQDYVRDHFQLRNFFGKECYLAFRTGSVERWNGPYQRKPAQGVVPGDLDRKEYTEGLPEGTTLSQWIEQHKRGKDPLIFEFSTHWNDGMMGSMLDD